MNVIEQKIQALKTFERDLYDCMRVTVVENEHIIADMNAKIQLYEKGVNRLGERLDSYRPYSPITIRVKLAKGQPTNRVTLRDEGDFHASFRVIANNISFFIDATDIKTEDLIAKYGEQILGLTDENLYELVWEYMYPDLIDNLKKALTR